MPKKPEEKRRWIQVESSNVGAVRFWINKESSRHVGTLDVVFKTKPNEDTVADHEWTIKCGNCRPKIFYRYKDVHIVTFVEMLFDESTGSYFNREIKAAGEAPEKLELVWP